MHSNEAIGSDGDLDALARLVADAETAADAGRAAQIREVRVLAAAGRLAEKQAAGSSEKVKAREMALRGIAAELAGVFVATDRTLQRRIDEARDLVENYPLTVAAWEAGRIVRAHVRVIQDVGCVIPADVREEFELLAIEKCEGETPNRVRAALDFLAQRLHPRTFTERHEEASAGRCIRAQAGPDGMSDLIATLPTAIPDGIVDRLTRQAREIINARLTRMLPMVRVCRMAGRQRARPLQARQPAILSSATRRCSAQPTRGRRSWATHAPSTKYAPTCSPTSSSQEHPPSIPPTWVMGKAPSARFARTSRSPCPRSR